MEIDKLHSREEINLYNKNLFKGKDLGLLKKVRNYLEDNNLHGELVGGIVNDFNKGRIRHYRDIDIAIKTNKIRKRSENHKKYSNVVMNLYQEAYINRKNPNGWIVKDFSDFHPIYSWLKIIVRFMIEDPKTNTKIDLSFGEDNKDALETYFPKE